MTVWNVDKNAEAKTMVITAEFKASVANVWQLWADRACSSGGGARQDSRPPSTTTISRQGARSPTTCPAPTAATGSTAPGTWSRSTPPPGSFVEDAIVDDDGTPSDGNSMTRMEIDIEAAGDTTRMILTTHFDSLEGIERAIATGVVVGMKACMFQIDTLLAEVAA